MAGECFKSLETGPSAQSENPKCSKIGVLVEHRHDKCVLKTPGVLSLYCLWPPQDPLVNWSAFPGGVLGNFVTGFYSAKPVLRLGFLLTLLENLQVPHWNSGGVHVCQELQRFRLSSWPLYS
jgi:hypothetical protein